MTTIPQAPTIDYNRLRGLQYSRNLGDRIRRGEHKTILLFTTSEEYALKLKAAFLRALRGPAQVGKSQVTVHTTTSVLYIGA